MFPVQMWSAFLRDRGIVTDAEAVSRLQGGEVNDNWAITDRLGREWVLRHYRRTLDPSEVAYELAAADRLASAGFPTPAPVKDRTGRLFDLIDGQPAALFTRASGTHPPQREGGYGSLDLAVGEQAAALAARLHRGLAGISLPGYRSPERDPWRRLDRFLRGTFADHPLFADVADELRATHDRLTPLYRSPSDGLPTGVVHHDLTPSNLLLDPDGTVAAVLDFDDCVDTFLAYELAPITSAFGCDENRRLDPARLTALVTAYHHVRNLTPSEQRHLPDLLAVDAAAEGLDVLTAWLLDNRHVDDPRDSFSMQTFIDITSNRHGVRDAASLARLYPDIWPA